MGTRYNIAITATDAATAKVRAIKAGFRSLVSPITDIGKSVKSLGKEVGVDKLASGLATVHKEAIGALKSIGAIDPAMAGLGIGASLAAVGAFAKSWIDAAGGTLRFAQVSGLAAGKVQVLEGAAQLAGLKAEDMDSSIKQLGATLQDARWGRNQGVLLMMNRLGLQFRKTKDGAIDQAAVLGDLAELFGPGGKLANVPVQTKALVAQQFGVEALLPMLLRGRKAWDDYNRASAQARSPISDEDLKKADQFRQSVDDIGLSFKSLGNALMVNALPGMQAFSKWIDQRNKNAVGNIKKYGLGGAISRGYAATVNDIFQATYGNAGRFLSGLIGKGEGDYNSVNLGKAGGYQASHRDLEKRTIAQVMAAQRAGEFNAAGKYQVTRETLSDAVKTMHLDTSKNFDRATQDKIFNEYLLKMKRPEIGNYIAGKSDDLHAAVKAASKEWASIQDPDTGRSHYDGIANNKATISADQVAAALQAARRKTAIDAATGKDAEKATPYRIPSGDQSKPDQVAAAPGLPQVWKDGAKQATAKSDVSATITIKGLPAGAKAEVADQNGPVKTVLKVESSMPDYNL